MCMHRLYMRSKLHYEVDCASKEGPRVQQDSLIYMHCGADEVYGLSVNRLHIEQVDFILRFRLYIEECK